MKMLLIIEALLLILAALRQDHRAAAEEITLDMAPDSFDDQYDDDLYTGCTEKTEKLVDAKYLKKESEKSENFKLAWEAGEKEFTGKRDNLAKNHLIAIYVYTLDRDYSVYRDFNIAVRTGKNNYKNEKFTWFTLHFWLTKAVQILKKTQNKTYEIIYRGTKSKFKGERDTTFRFGSFTSFSSRQEIAEDFAKITDYETGHCFEIENYKGAEVSKYSAYPGEKEVLIPPYEIFKVTAVKTNDWCSKVFVLASAGGKSDLNCALIEYNTIILSKLFKCCAKL